MRLIIILLCLGMAACTTMPEGPVPGADAPAHDDGPLDLPPAPEPEPELAPDPEPETELDPLPEAETVRSDAEADRELPAEDRTAHAASETRPETAPPVTAAPEPETDTAAPVEPAAPAPVESPPPGTAQARIEGHVQILRNGRPQPFAASYLGQTVVAWRPADGVATTPMSRQQIMTRRSRFFPQTLAVTTGTSVRFPNMDTIEHNVFSLTPGHRFDVGLYGQDEGRAHRFDGSGMVELYCNVHPNMAAFVLVLDTPWFVSPDDDGNFHLDGLPPGPGELLVWNYRAEQPLQLQQMNLGDQSPQLELILDITRPAVPQHTNKHGEPYRQRRR